MKDFNNELEDQSIQPLLEKEGGFTVPSSYFDEFSFRLNKRLPDNKIQKPTFLVWVSYTVIASVLLMFSLFVNLSENSINTNEVASAPEIYSEDVLFEVLDEEDVINFLVYEDDF